MCDMDNVRNGKNKDTHSNNCEVRTCSLSNDNHISRCTSYIHDTCREHMLLRAKII